MVSLLIAALIATASGCVGKIGEPGPGAEHGGGSSPDNGNGIGAGGGAGPGSAAGGNGSGTASIENVSPTVVYAMGRLTNTQYQNSVADLFPTVTLPTLPLPNENVVDGYNNAASGQTPTPLLVQDYQAAAETVTQALASNMTAVLGCQPKTSSDETSCAQTFIASFGKRAYRRPLTGDESTRLLNFYKAARGNDDFPTSMGLVVQLLLQSPYFVYRLEAGNPQRAQGDLIPLTSYEIASRLSYFLTNSTPDAALTQAADQDALQDPAAVEAQARRLIMDPRAKSAVATFNYQWLKMSKLEGLTKDPRYFPNFTPDVAQALHDATVQFVDYAFWQANSLTAMLTDSHAFVNDALAPIYGLKTTGSKDLKLTALDPIQRAGILTQAGMLASLAGQASDSPVQRGLLVMSKFLCQTPPPPPPGVNTTLPAADPNAPMTTRQRMEQTHATGSCAACHGPMDAIGFAFENYDAVGAWRTQENGLSVDASAALTGTDVDGSFTGAVPLAQHLAGSAQVATCVSYEWLRYALGLDTTQINVAAARSIGDAFSASGGAFTEMLVALVKSDYFRSLKVSN